MADDYLLTAIENFTSGFGKTLGESKQLEYQDALARRRDREQNALLSNKQKEQADLELSQFKQKLPLQEQSQIRIAKATKETQPGTEIVDPITGAIIRKTSNKVVKADILKDSNKSDKPLTTEGRKIVGNLGDGIKSIDNALKLAKKSPVATRAGSIDLPVLGNVPGRVAASIMGGGDDSSRFNYEIKNASDVLARYRTGAAINNAELKLYSTLLNDALASDEVREENLMRVRDFFENVKNEIQNGTRTFKDVSEGGNISDGNVSQKNLKIGSVEDGYRYIGGDPADPASWEEQ